jgi:glycosyltransferase involved in cell wall biosynthesis
MMRVLHVIPSVGSARGGPSVAVLAMVRALRLAGVKADIATTNDNGATLLPVKCGEWIDHEGTRIYFHQRWSPAVGSLREFQYASSFGEWLERVLPEYDGVHVHAVFSYLSTKAMRVCRKLGKPYIIRPLGLLDSWSLQQKAWKKRLYFALGEGRNIRGAVAVHCTSAVEAGNVKALFPTARREVLAHGVEPTFCMPDAARRMRERWTGIGDGPVILFLSRWAVKKNIPILLEALAQLKNQPWTLMLAGAADDGYEAVVKAAITGFGLSDRVICPGHVQGDDKALLLRGSDCFVLPSITENFGVAVAEALCCGLPCVVTEGVDIAPTVLALNGGQVCKADALALRKALLTELSLSRENNTLAETAQEIFSWEAVGCKLVNLYADLFKS